MGKSYDVIIVGAGFAGITAARELTQKGYKTLVLEAKDRLGGRTWVENRLGRDLELGGTWVHWSQPHTWAEITRYNLEITQSPVPEKAYWLADNKRNEGTADELLGKLDKGMVRLLEDARNYFPLPYAPLHSDTLHEIDHLTVADKLRSLGLSKEEYDLIYSMWALNFNGSPEDGALSQAYRWVSLTNYDWQYLFESSATYKLKNGTKELIEAIAGDTTADISYSKPVSSVEKTLEGYKVKTITGEEFYSKTVIVTLPLNVLNRIKFKPGLSEGKHQAGEEGQTSKGVKFWAKLKGKFQPFVAMAPADYPINFAQLEYINEKDSIIVGFGPDSKRINIENKVEVERALRHLIPDLEVLESTGHDWVDDEYCGETWPMQRKNQLTKYLAELQRPEDGLFLSGSDYANGWAGFIDGAIESAFTTSKLVEIYFVESNQKLEA
ncbi:flavin monoamine oxidase family protein [Salipaludibacillus sp. CF4.18]|uniref:flavin monoamine oxidase family protein n=1 Tax=Salipaludibacillus sp. CF4.18 TaxID=3373081 RepID=UPI003EE5B203